MINLESREKRALQNVFKRFLSLLVAACIAAVLLTSYLSFLNHQRAAFQDQRDLISQAQNDYNNHIVNLVSIVHALEVNYVETLTNGGTKADVEALFASEVDEIPAIDQLRIINLFGMETIRVNKADDGAYIVPPEDLQDKSNRYYYLETRFLGRNHFLFSVLDLNFEHNAIEIDPVSGLTKPTFRISKPIVIDEVRIGYFVVNFLMRDYLASLRTSANMDGVATLLFDQAGYLLNDVDDSHNFGFNYDEAFPERQYTVHSLYPGVDLTADYGSKIENGTMYSYAGYTNLSNLSDNYFLSASASKTLYFLVSFNQQSPYGHYIRFSVWQSFADTWHMQIMVAALLALLYILLIYASFLLNRKRFTNTYADNRYDKSTLKKALHNHEFINYFQPIIDIQSGSVLGFEALARWNNGKEVLTPDQFMDEIENYELSEELDKNTYRNIREARRRLTALGITDYQYISINFSQQTFQSMLKDNTSEALHFDDDDKQYMLVELLENIIIHKASANKIYELHSQNVNFTIDDFGTGNSNIAFIRNFVDLSVKIDKTFVPKNIANRKERIIIEAFVKMFLDKGRKLIVEGVETQAQYQYLKSLKVTGIQGYYFSKPLSFDQLVEFMRHRDYQKKLA